MKSSQYLSPCQLSTLLGQSVVGGAAGAVGAGGCGDGGVGAGGDGVPLS